MDIRYLRQILSGKYLCVGECQCAIQYYFAISMVIEIELNFSAYLGAEC